MVDSEWSMENGSDGSSPRKTISSRASLRQLMPAILDCPGDFAHPIRTGRNLVFKLDGRLDIAFVIWQPTMNWCLSANCPSRLRSSSLCEVFRPGTINLRRELRKL